MNAQSQSNWSFWKNNVADMPGTDKDGNWVDLETGIPYDQWHNYQAEAKRAEKAKARKSVSAKAKDSRSLAKALGGKALAGTAAQKNWAEKIREEFLNKMTEADAIEFVRQNSLFGHSKFWIENRDRSAAQLVELNNKRLAVYAEYQTAQANKDADAVKRLADEYSKIISALKLA